MSYICGSCKKEVTIENLKTMPGIKCPYCGYRILYKVRPPIVKKIICR
ncbi:MAG: DNA-directed RNA polymerase subunit P [Candidatus Odinarchaeota archaeon]